VIFAKTSVVVNMHTFATPCSFPTSFSNKLKTRFFTAAYRPTPIPQHLCIDRNTLTLKSDIGIETAVIPR